MIHIERIVCPVDFSDFSRHALDFAVSLARWYDARVTVLHVYAPAVPPVMFARGAAAAVPPPAVPARERDDVMRDLAAFVDIETGGSAPVELRVAEGTAWREIVAAAGAANADLIVLGTHGRCGFERLLLGSVAEKVLRAAPCPVLTVSGAVEGAAAAAAGLIKRIVFATDFSPEADAAGRWATSLAQEADAELVVLHVLDAPLPTESEGFPRSALASYRRSYEEWNRARLREAVADSVREACTVTEVTRSGTPHREILRAAAEHHAELIVLGVGGHRGLGDRMFGSTSQQVVRAATCPVLTVREGARRASAEVAERASTGSAR